MINWAKNMLSVFRIVGEVPSYFVFFLLINVAFGGMGLWLPPILAANDLQASPTVEFIKVIRQGNGYLFALPLLAAASMYLFREYRESKNSEFKDIKLTTFIITLVLMMVMGVTLGPCVTSQFDVSNSIQPAQIRPPMSGFGMVIEIILTLASLLLAIFLFCLELIDDYQQYGKGLKDRARKKLEEQMDAAANTTALKL
ncbi:hypothetical protein [Paraburkholderia solisilvae]|uniref:Uncharacterized protein n=1 Tax=Paraburkholderia solisilvae TaxID=624376 RepID=A0A6J5EVK9_9BURK|nr:hypothetical protein [Paraburkholderia solisilvae]CAB3770233.1 hypothetical protein LMG29739_05739 [Paraburkholderia solisilvae]